MNKIISALFSTILFACLYSCQKDNSEPPPVIPADTTVTFLPSSIAYVSANYPEENVVANFVYSQTDRTIKVNITYPQSTSIYEDIGNIIYYYTDNGYLQKSEKYYESGKLFERFIVERDNSNILKRVLIERDAFPQKDTFAFSFRDSASTYKIMKVDARYQSVLGSDAKTTNEYTFRSNKLVKQNEVLFSDSVGEITLTAGCIQSYDAFDRLISAEYNNGYKEFYSYEASSTGLDSFYHVIGGKDDYYLSTYDEWPAAPYASDGFYSYPLYLSLYTPEGSVDGYMHKGGALLEKRSSPNNVVFSFQNTFDRSNRITETKIMNKGALFGTYKITY